MEIVNSIIRADSQLFECSQNAETVRLEIVRRGPEVGRQSFLTPPSKSRL